VVVELIIFKLVTVEEALLTTREPRTVRVFPASNVSLAVARRKSVESRLSKVAASPPPPAEMQLPFKSAKQPLVMRMPLAKVEVAVEEALRPPVRIRLPVTVEEPTETNPPPKVDRLATDKVEEAESGPETLRLAVTVEEPTEIKAPPKLVRLLTLKVEDADKGPVTLRLAEKVEEAVERIPTENV